MVPTALILYLFYIHRLKLILHCLLLIGLRRYVYSADIRSSLRNRRDAEDCRHAS